MENTDQSDEEGGTPGLQAELLQSYLAFARRAIDKHRRLAISIFVVITLATCAALAVWPRSYHSELRLLVQRSAVLDADEKSNPLESASQVITRTENLEALVHQLDLVAQWDGTRPMLMSIKDHLLERLRGKPSAQDMNDALVSMLDGRLSANAHDGVLTISVDWPDAATARRIVDAAKDSFLQSRHNGEISVIEEKMSILEGHASRVRAEIEEIAQELGRLKDEKLAAAEKVVRQVSQAAAPAAPAAAPVLRRVSPAPSAGPKAMSEEDLATLKEELETKKRKLAELQARRNQSVLEAKGRLVDLKLKYTDDHPEVHSAEERLSIVSLVSGEESTLGAEVSTLQTRIKQGSSRTESAPAQFRGSGSTPAAVTTGAATAGAETLPTEILKLLDNPNDMDPAIGAQLSTALSKYSELRSEIRGERVSLDTAQAAFNYRYKILSPAVTPLKPSKPKVPLMIAAGLLVALMLGLAVPVLLELKTGVIVERWQVRQIHLPLLGEVNLPSRDQ